MTGYNMVLKIRRLEEKLDELGFMLAHARYGTASEFGDVVSIKPRGDALPVYARDAEIWSGTLEALEYWLQGMEWARSYDNMLGVSGDRRRCDAEKRYHARMEKQRIRNEQNLVLRILSTPTEQLKDR